MKRTYRVLVALLVAVVMASMTAVAAFAKSDYTYTVRIFGGNNGMVKGQEIYTYSDTLTEGELVTLNKGWVTVEDGSKYYVKGFRESGKDELHAESFNVTSDVDLVVAYGVEGDMVTARINFIEYESGNALTADNGQTYMTFTGKVGDRFMLPFEYVTGYRPRYLNVTGVLGESGNEWNLEYIPLA
ncbi:MAG: hypothetical protein IKE22_07830, partial [Atopobiaceae bacterium]|nr:hypothetical protein [Atopobiaceae bacterium]